MQIIKLFLTLTVFIAYAYAVGETCELAETLNAADLNTDLNNVGLGYKEFTFSATGTTPASTSYGFLTSIQGGNCFASPQKGYWFKWSPTQTVFATIELTTATENDRTYDSKLVIYSILSSEPANQCQETNKLSCEGNIRDMCQGYPVKAPTYKFFSGRTYYFFVNTEVTGATYSDFYVSFIKRAFVFQENFEDRAVNQLPTDWTSVSSSQYGGWKVNNAAGASAGDINFQNVDASPVGGIGNRMLYINPFQNGPLTPSNCVQDANLAACNQSINYVTTKGYDLTAEEDYELLFDSYFFNGYTGSQQTIRIIGDLLASTDNGATFSLVYTMPNISATYNKFVTQRIPLHEYVGESNVMFRFLYKGLVSPPNFGWAIDNIAIVPKIDSDMCEDDLACTYHTCSIAGSNTDPRGCKKHDNDTYCEVGQPTCVLSECGAGPANNDGCVWTNRPSECNDHLSCTDDTCNTHANADPITGCYNEEDDTQCTDGKGCTLDKCANKDNKLSLENIWDGPVSDGGTGTGCIFIPDCDDGVKCTDDSCEKAFNNEEKCLHTINLQLCDDNIDCTYELTCDPEQPGYDKLISGCIRVPMNEWCDDNDPCTIDTCEPSLNMTNSCVNTNVTCDDCLQCTFDYCVDGACEHEPIHDMCDDHFDCTVDVCDESLGKCTNNPNDTYCEYFGDLCSHHYCRPWASTDGSGCVAVAKVCDDEIACSEDYCNPLTGNCFFEPNNTKCEDTAECTNDECSLELGKCVNKPDSLNCNDGDSCTVDYCSMSGMCEAYTIDCTDEVVCSDDSCVDGACVHNFNHTNCDDGFDCTVDKCDESLGKCTNNPDDSHCAAITDPCKIAYCNVESSADSTGCYFVEKDCADAITCTYDFCDELTGECHHVANDSFCDDGHECTVDLCDIELGKCTNFADNSRCEDGNGCTERDICGDDGECHYVDLYCNDQIYCTVDFCDPNTPELCQHVANNSLCDDGNDCTDDYCSVELGRCVNIPMDSWCPGRSECETGTCSLEAGACVYESHDDICDDLVGCTIDVCNGPEGCSRIARDSLCNDGLGCTEDICNGTGCQYIPHNNWCYDGIGCTEDICSTTDDCIITPQDNLCDDSINCTRDYCSATEDCINEEVDSWCSDGIGCTIDKCDKTNADGLYCSSERDNSLCEDGFQCSENTCEYDIGCVTNYTDCPWYDRTLDDKICIECMSSGAQIVQNHYQDGTGAMVFSTLASDTGLQDRMVLTPSNNVIIGGDQDSIPVHKDDGLVVGTNMRIVPQQSGVVPPVCNEIRRGTIVVVQESYPCGEDECHRDVVQVCVLDSTYHYQTINTQPAATL